MALITIEVIYKYQKLRIQIENRRGRDHMVVVLTITYAINCEFEFRSLRGVFDTTLCDNAYQ